MISKKRYSALGFVSLLALATQPACTQSETAPTQAVTEFEASDRNLAAINFPTELGEVWGPENEKQLTTVITTTLSQLIDRSVTQSLVHRDAHPKHHGCVKAFFKVDPSALPAELRAGVFAGVGTGEYPAWIRFSNGGPNGVETPDLNADVRGMAVKLMGIDGTPTGSQDFLMCTAKEFFSKDAADYAALHTAMGSGGLALGWYFLTHPKNALNIKRSTIKTPNPLQTNYFSSLPYKLGPRMMRFKAVPCDQPSAFDSLPTGSAATPNYLRERLVSTLASRPNGACFDFFVQPNMDPAQPLENPTVTWDETRSPYIKVATITIPQQSQIDSQARLNFCENLTFDPWHTLPETRPLGQISRMRRKIYPVITRYRHQINHIPIIEPKSHEICMGETAPLCQTPHR